MTGPSVRVGKLQIFNDSRRRPGSVLDIARILTKPGVGILNQLSSEVFFLAYIVKIWSCLVVVVVVVVVAAGMRWWASTSSVFSI